MSPASDPLISNHEARKCLIKARLYRIFAVLFACVGLLLFVLLYLRNVEGRIFQAFQDPMMAVILLVPFLPAAILSLISRRLENRYFRLVDKS